MQPFSQERWMAVFGAQSYFVFSSYKIFCILLILWKHFSWPFQSILVKLSKNSHKIINKVSLAFLCCHQGAEELLKHTAASLCRFKLIFWLFTSLSICLMLLVLDVSLWWFTSLVSLQTKTIKCGGVLHWMGAQCICGHLHLQFVYIIL